jgi:hypothetical protein
MLLDITNIKNQRPFWIKNNLIFTKMILFIIDLFCEMLVFSSKLFMKLSSRARWNITPTKPLILFFPY